MSLLGNIIWLVFGGLITALEYFVSSVLLCITIIGIPFGLQTLKLAEIALWPFGRSIQIKKGNPGVSFNLYEPFVAYPWRYLDIAYPPAVRNCTLYYNYWYTLWHSTFQTRLAGIDSIWPGSDIKAKNAYLWHLPDSFVLQCKPAKNLTPHQLSRILKVLLQYFQKS